MKQITIPSITILLLILLSASTYRVEELEQAIVLQFGQVKGEPITESGLHWKLPFIQNIRKFDKRILHWDGARGEIPTLDKKFIWVDTTARWRISDALQFYRAVRDVDGARSRMDTVLDGITPDTISAYNLIEVVRTSNDIMRDVDENRKEALKDPDNEEAAVQLDELTADLPKVSYGREKISELIAARARKELQSFGIHLIDVQLRSIAYREKVEQKVYNRMISERRKIATKIRSNGKKERLKILGKMDLKLKEIESQAYRKSQEIRGKAEAESISIYAASLKKDPSYYSFVKTLETYKNTLAKKRKFYSRRIVPS